MKDKVEVTENEFHRTVTTTTKHGKYISSKAKLNNEGVDSEVKEEGRKARLAELKRRHGR